VKKRAGVNQGPAKNAGKGKGKGKVPAPAAK
jgi:hypothetical protein